MAVTSLPSWSSIPAAAYHSAVAKRSSEIDDPERSVVRRTRSYAGTRSLPMTTTRIAERGVPLGELPAETPDRHAVSDDDQRALAPVCFAVQPLRPPPVHLSMHAITLCANAQM